MLRRRPIARMAVRTTAVVGTAAVVGGHVANKQAQAQPNRPNRPSRTDLHPPRPRLPPPTPSPSSPSWPL